MKKGFTLIELLVVVLIIGILSSVALPQYQKAVEKSRSTQAITLLKSVSQAAMESFMANGGSSFSSFDELSVEIPWQGREKWGTSSYIKDTRSNGEWSLQFYQDNADHSGTLYVGRLAGKYKGAGFAMEINPNLNHQGELVCVERFSSGITFQEPDGAFCQRIMNARPISIGFTSMRTYQMPY